MVFGKFYRQIKKNNDDVNSCCWDLKISNLLKLYIDYHFSKFQISWLSGSNFMEVSVRHQILSLFLVMTLFLAYFVEHNISYQPCKFQLSRISGSNFTEGVKNTPPSPSAAPGEKSPVLLGLTGGVFST